MTAALQAPPEATGPANRHRPSLSGRLSARGGAWWSLVPVTLLALFFVWPLVTVARQTFHDRLGRPAGWTVWRRVLGSAEFRAALGHTLQISLISTVCCLLLGTFFAVVLAFVPFRGSAAVTRALTMVLAFPSFFIALSFAVLYGSTGVFNSAAHTVLGAHDLTGDFIYTRWAVILAEVTFYTPFVLRPVLAACQRMPADHLTVAASLGAGPVRVIRTVLLPELVPAMVAGGALTLLLTLNEFGIVLFIGAKGVLTLPVLVYTKGIVTSDYPGACVLACVQVALSLTLYLTGRSLARRLGGLHADLV